MSSQKGMFDGLPILEASETKWPRCKVCQSDTEVFDCVDFYKHCSATPYGMGLSGVSIPYYRCMKCSFLFTDFIDGWTSEEVSRYIYNSEYIKVDPEYLSTRPLRAAEAMSQHFAGCEKLRILDYGSGSGVFSTRMKELGFLHVDNYDPLSSPDSPGGSYDLITCFEVVEHSPKPIDTFVDMAGRLADGGAIVIGQTLQPADIEDIGGRWWYLAPRNGHVSFFADETFMTIADRLNLTYHRGADLFAFSRGTQSKPLATFIRKLGGAVHLQTLLAPDPGASAPGWHAAESNGSGSHRWSAISELTWSDVDLRCGVNLIQIPYLLAIRTGFERECIVTVDGKAIDVNIQKHRFLAEIEVTKARRCRIRLLTPPPRSPSELRGSPDTRRLGIAVYCR